MEHAQEHGVNTCKISFAPQQQGGVWQQGSRRGHVSSSKPLMGREEPKVMLISDFHELISTQAVILWELQVGYNAAGSKACIGYEIKKE